MQQTKITCDLCKTETICNYPSNVGFKNVVLEFGQYNRKNYDLCPDCLKKYGLVNDAGGAKTLKEEPTIAEKLYEIIAEIVNENMDS